MMPHEIRRASFTSSTASGTTKKNKHKKVPQRGLGVAQLEKLRMEEQQKNAADAAVDYLPQTAMSKSRVDPSSTAGAAASLLLNPSDPLPFTNIGLLVSPPPQQAPDGSAAGPGRTSGRGFLPTLFDGSSAGPHEAEAVIKNDTFRSSLQTHPMITSLLHRMMLQQQHQPAATANKAMASSSSSGQSVQIEPPSNQNYTNSSHDWGTCWKEEDEMHGASASIQMNSQMASVKRKSTFLVDNSGSALHPRKVPALSSSYGEFDPSLPPYGRNRVVQAEAQSTVFRGCNSVSSVHSTSADVQVDSKGKQNAGRVDGPFQTLGIDRQTSKHLLNPAFTCCDSYDRSSVQCEGSLNSNSILNDQQTYSFFPAIDERLESTSIEKEDVMNDIDLDLKL